jgi:hypothetical protein
MRFVEISYGSDGGNATVRLGRRLTVISGLDAPARHQWVRQVLGALHGTPPGYGTSLVLQDASGRRVRLTRDAAGATSAIDVESGEDLTGDLGDDGRLDWLALFQLDQVAARAVMIVEAETEAAGWVEELAQTRELLARVEAEQEHETARVDSRAVPAIRDGLTGVEKRLQRRASDVQRATDRLEEAAPDMAPPSLPWVPALARMDLADLWARAELLQSSGTRVAEIERARGGIDGDTVTRIEAAHAEVEKAEFRLERLRLTNRAAREHLAEAREAEREILDRAGFESWLGFRLWWADAPLGTDADDSLEAAELELQQAADAWTEVAGDVAVEAALAVREEVESYAAYLARVDSGATEAACRAALEKAEAAYRAAMEERAGLVQELAAIEAGTARIASLAEHGDALRHRVSVLEASARPLASEDPEMALLGRFAVARRVGPRSEPLPLLFDDALVRYRRGDKWFLLDLLARLGGAAQVVYLTDDPETARWASIRSLEDGVAFLDASARPVVTCRDCGRAASVCLVQVAGADLCTACALVRVGVRNAAHRVAQSRRHATSRR